MTGTGGASSDQKRSSRASRKCAQLLSGALTSELPQRSQLQRTRNFNAGSDAGEEGGVACAPARPPPCPCVAAVLDRRAWWSQDLADTWHGDGGRQESAMSGHVVRSLCQRSRTCGSRGRGFPGVWMLRHDDETHTFTARALTTCAVQAAEAPQERVVWRRKHWV